MDQKLLQILRRDGVISAGNLMTELGVSRATLSRLIAKSPRNVIRIGQTRATHYGLAMELPGLGDQLPVFRVTQEGSLAAVGKLRILHSEVYLFEPGTQIFRGLPPQFADMAPQGYLGRSFSQRFARELEVPLRPLDWSNHHILISEARRGEDLPGDLILGQESAQRWIDAGMPKEYSRKQYPTLARASLSGQRAGSSAGGEQPKFLAFVEGRQVLVKFADADRSLSSLRWRDLLYCEQVALQTLSTHGLSSSRATVHEVDGMVFLEIERFDRVGARGRLPALTLAAVDDTLHGMRDSWASAGDRLAKAKMISEEEARKLRLLDAFGALIGDTDRHFHNISFIPGDGVKQHLGIDKLKLAPAFDKLPMMFAPISGQIVQRELTPVVPSAAVIDVWEEARGWARVFWKQVSGDTRISREFRAIAKKFLSTL